MKYILVINCGSATLKFTIYDYQFTKIISGNLERIGLGGSFLSYQVGHCQKTIHFKKIKNHHEALTKILSIIDFSLDQIKLIGHRVVTGGYRFLDTTLVTPAVFRQLKKNDDIVPLHNSANMMGITSCLKLLPMSKNAAVFDTSFYKNLPDYAYTYGLPLNLAKKYHIRRYGFHGISHQYVAQEASKKLKKPLNKLNLITCHLGSGCSITAIKLGKAIDTSMGFTPLEGLLMGTRSGDLDPAIVTYLMNKLRMSTNQIDQLLNKQSGLKGIFGISDLREVLVAAGYRVGGFKTRYRFNKEQKRRAKLALSVYLYRIKKYISAYYGILGRVDAIVFTAGTGERNPLVKKMIIRDLPFLKSVKILVIPTNEELMIAKEALKICE